MKKASRQAASRHGVWCVVVLAGCAGPQQVPEGEQFVELARTTNVTLTIANDSGRDLEVVGLMGEAPRLAPGASVEVPLVVTKVAKLSEMDPGGAAGAKVPRPGAAFYTVESAGSGVVEPLAAESVVRVRAGTEVWKFYLVAEECVLCGEHAAMLHVRRRPSLADAPTSLCRP